MFRAGKLIMSVEEGEVVRRREREPCGKGGKSEGL